MQIVNTTQVSLDYEVNKVGPSGIGKVELWVTQDDGQWKVFGAQVREMATKVREQMGAAPAVPPAPPAAPRAPLPPEPVVLTEDIKGCDAKDGKEGKETVVETKDGKKVTVKCNVRVQVVRLEPGKAMPPLPALQAPPAVLARTMAFAPRTTRIPCATSTGCCGCG